MDTTYLFFIALFIIFQIINIALTISALGSESEAASDNDPSVLDAYYLYYTCSGF